MTIKALQPYKIKNLELRNRIVMPPMCMYSAVDGYVNDFHVMHYGEPALGGTGLILQEATAIVPEGRISDEDLGIWSDDHVPGLKRVVDIVHRHGAAAGIQLAHAGRKARVTEGTIVAPSAIAFKDNWAVPKELSLDEIEGVVKKFAEAAMRADKAGYDVVEIHGAHGYLISEFLSPLTNHREDAYGGSVENRSRLLSEVIDSVRRVWKKPILLRVSAEDWMEGGIHLEDMVEILRPVEDKVDMIHVSSGGVMLSENIPLYPGYQVKLAEGIKQELKVPTIAVGLIDSLEMAEELLRNDRCDLVAIGRGILRDPHWVLNQAFEAGGEVEIPQSLKRAYRKDTTYR